MLAGGVEVVVAVVAAPVAGWFLRRRPKRPMVLTVFLVSTDTLLAFLCELVVMDELIDGWQWRVTRARSHDNNGLHHRRDPAGQQGQQARLIARDRTE